jgi:hypothetical protein
VLAGLRASDRLGNGRSCTVATADDLPGAAVRFRQPALGLLFGLVEQAGVAAGGLVRLVHRPLLPGESRTVTINPQRSVRQPRLLAEAYNSSPKLT